MDSFLLWASGRSMDGFVLWSSGAVFILMVAAMFGLMANFVARRGCPYVESDEDDDEDA